MPTTMTFGLNGAVQSLPAEVRIAYDLKLLKAARPNLLHIQFADKRPIPKNMGTSIQLRRFELLYAAGTAYNQYSGALVNDVTTAAGRKAALQATPGALQEGVTPVADSLVVSSVNIPVLQYGNFLQVTDVLSWVAIDPVLSEAADKLGQNAGQTLDQLARDFIVAGSNVQFAGGGTTRSGVTPAQTLGFGAELKKAVRTLEKGFVDKIGGDYIAIVSPDTKYDIMGISEWINAREYSDPKDMYAGELGKLYGIRFVESPLAKIYAGSGIPAGTAGNTGGSTGQDIHATLIFGNKPFSCTEITGESLNMIVKPLGSAGALDPLNQRATSAWKASFGGTIVNQNFCVRVEHSVTP